MPEIAQLAAELGRDRLVARMLQTAPASGPLDVASGSREPSAGGLVDASVSSFATAPESISDPDEHHSSGKAGPTKFGYHGSPINTSAIDSLFLT